MADHIPVLLNEVMDNFAPHSSDTLLDATLGLGGHAEAYLQRSAPHGRVVGLDADAAAITEARKRLATFGGRVHLINKNFAQLKDSIQGGGIVQAPLLFTHILFDLGIGSHQLADATRGFSFKSNESLTMRYGAADNLPASQLKPLNHLSDRLGYFPDVADILAGLSAEDLAQVIYVYGEERYSRRIAAVLKQQKVHTAAELASAISNVLPAQYERGRIHPATRTFQALRLAVNRELETVAVALPQAVELLAPGGKLAVISFHSLEDRIVKRFMREQAMACVCPPPQPVCTCRNKAALTLVTKKPIRATEEEMAKNPRSRSAKMRIAQKNDT